MKNLLKYLIVAAFGLILHGAADKLDAQLAFASVADLAGSVSNISRKNVRCTSIPYMSLRVGYMP